MVKLAFIYLLLLFHSYDQHQVTYLHTGEPHRNVSGVFGLVEWEPNSISCEARRFFLKILQMYVFQLNDLNEGFQVFTLEILA